MARSDVYSAFSAIVPIAHMAWRVGQAPALPWAVFYLDGSEGFNADNAVYCKSSTWILELYQKSCDTSLEASIESAIVSNFGPFTKSEAWVEMENCIQTTYVFTELGD